MSSLHSLVAAAGAVALGYAISAGPASAGPTCPKAGWVVVEQKASTETLRVKAGPKGSVLVRKVPITTTSDLTEIKLGGDAYDTQVAMKFTSEAAKRLHDATNNKDGLHIAFVVGDRALSAVTWTGPYGMDADQGVQISLGTAQPEMRPLVEAIQNCIHGDGKG